MNMPNFDERWNAWIDGELSEAEAAEFLAGLSAADRERLERERAFEQALCEKLAAPARCPDAVWNAVKTRAGSADTVVPFEPRAHRPLWYASVVAAAVLVAFSLATLLQNRPTDNSAIVMAAATIEELAAESQVPAGRENAERFLREHGIDLGLGPEADMPIAALHHDIFVVGAREGRVRNQPVHEILFGCCGYPVKLVAARSGSRAADALRKAAERDGNDIQALREVGGYVTAVVGQHDAHGLLDVFEQ